MGLTFFMTTDSEFTYQGLQDHLKKRRLKFLDMKHKFNWKRWRELNETIRTLKTRLDIKN